MAVDRRGDAWVLDSESATEPARLSKVAAERERCRDRDGDGLETSLGRDDLRDADECIVLSVQVGEAGERAQALAIDGAPALDLELAGNAWVGFASAQRVRMYSGDDAAPLSEVELPGFAAHAGAFDVWGTLWLVERAGRLAQVDPASAPARVSIHDAQLACYAFDALSVVQDRPVLIASSSCESVAGFDPQRERFRDRRVPGLLSPRALAAHGGEHWLVFTSGQLASFDPASLAAGEPLELSDDEFAPFESHELAFDESGKLWIVSTQGGPEGRGLVTHFDPASGQVVAQVPVGRGPRGGGDLTGLALGDTFVPEAKQRHVFESGCGAREGSDAGDGTRWKALHLSAVVGAGGEVEVSARRAPAREDFAAQPFETLGVFPADPPPYALSVEDEGVLEVELWLRARHATGAPRIARVGLEWTCAGPD